MKRRLGSRYEGFYRDHSDPWSYWKSEYEIAKYHQQISLVAQFSQPQHILEIGCSVGAHTKLIHEAFPEARITAIDISATAVARAAKAVPKTAPISFHAEDVFLFSERLDEGSYDVIFWSEAFDFLHDHCTIAEFSMLARRLSLALRPNGILCISHIVPRPLSHPAAEAGAKNVEVFHSLLRDYFHQLSLTSGSSWKEETDTLYRYQLHIYRPRLIRASAAVRTEISPGRVDVVIPARNEMDTVAAVVQAMRASPQVDRIIVVDNGSADDTRAAAANAGATVISCEPPGYGRAVKRGARETTSPWVLKLDADIENASPLWVDVLTRAARDESAALVRAFWTASREDPDRVTNFTAKPAFRIFFPELAELRSPLSGVYLFDRSALRLEQLPNNFAFDVAMLIQALNDGIPMAQRAIETVRHATIANGKRSYRHYHKMSDEVLRYIVEAGLERLQ